MKQRGQAVIAEAELTAIKKSDADLIRQEIASAKTMKAEIVDDSSDQLSSQPQENVIYKISHRQLLFFASTSGRAGVIISAVIAFSAQFEDLIPFDRIFNELGNYVRVGLYAHVNPYNYWAGSSLVTLRLSWHI